MARERLYSNEEIWKPIVNFAGYEVSNRGRIRSYRRGKVRYLHLIEAKDHYLRAQLYVGKKIKHSIAVSRLVAIAFIPNPLKLEQVNHINENVKDNRVENLEWCSPKYNSNYGTRAKRIADKLSKPVLQYARDGTFIRRFNSASEAAREIKTAATSISAVCRGEHYTHKNFVWKYE